MCPDFNKTSTVLRQFNKKAWEIIRMPLQVPLVWHWRESKIASLCLRFRDKMCLSISWLFFKGIVLISRFLLFVGALAVELWIREFNDLQVTHYRLWISRSNVTLVINLFNGIKEWYKFIKSENLFTYKALIKFVWMKYFLNFTPRNSFLDLLV